MNKQWINVNDQLPPITWTMSDLVLLTDGESISIGWYHIDDGWHSNIESMRPTHWLPIPKWRGGRSNG